MNDSMMDVLFVALPDGNYYCPICTKCGHPLHNYAANNFMVHVCHAPAGSTTEERK